MNARFDELKNNKYEGLTFESKSFSLSSDLISLIVKLNKDHKFSLPLLGLERLGPTGVREILDYPLSNGPEFVYQITEGSTRKNVDMIEWVLNRLQNNSINKLSVEEIQSIKDEFEKCLKSKVNTKYNVIIDSETDWKEGTFGDSGSCLWGGRQSARVQIKKYGAAVKVYNSDDNPVARAWLAPIDENSIVVFNGYAKSGTFDGMDYTLAVSKLVSEVFKYDHRKWINLRNTAPNSEKTNMFFNSGGGYCLSSKPVDIEMFDLKWKEEIIIKCCNCGKIVNDEDAIFSLRQPYCTKCAREKLSLCSFDFEQYPNTRMVKGPDDVMYFDENISKVEEFLMDDYNGVYIFRKDSIKLGEYTVHKNMLETHKTCKCGSIIEASEDTCITCKFMGDYSEIANEFIKKVLKQYSGDLEGVNISW